MGSKITKQIHRRKSGQGLLITKVEDDFESLNQKLLATKAEYQ